MGSERVLQMLDPEDAKAAPFDLEAMKMDQEGEEEGGGEGAPAPEGTEEVPAIAELKQQLDELRQRVGTDGDVSVVRSKYDKRINDMQVQQDTEVKELRNAVAQLGEQLVMARIQGLPKEQQAAVVAEYRAQMKIQSESEALAAREKAVAAKEQAQADEQETGRLLAIVDSRKETFRKAARAAGVDPSTLDLSTPDAAEKSLEAAIARQGRLTKNPPPTVPAPPLQKGQPAKSLGVDDFFDSKPREDIERIIARARQGGFRLEDLGK